MNFAARQLWPTGDPLRDRVWIGQGAGPAFEETRPREIIGVVGDVRQFALNQAARPGIYVPLAQMPDAQMAFISRAGGSATWALRTRLAPAGLASLAPRELLQATGVPVARIRTMDDVFLAATAPTVLNLSLMTAFGGLAVALAVLGLYSIAAYTVQQRTRELGIRLALGARASVVRNMVVWDSLRVALVGISVGLAVALASGRVMTSLLFEVTARDPVTMILVPVLLVGASFAGVYVPARRATRVDPLTALRSE